MTRRNSTPEIPLPVRPRPLHGESADSYLRRLAAANHLRFSYLRRYLATPRGSYGPIDAGGLADLAGREPHAILRAFPELGPAALRQPKPGRRYTREDIQHAYAEKHERYAVIRRDFDAGMSGRAIEREHHVGRRTIIKALDSAEPPARKKIHREPAALKGLHDCIDAMISADPAIATATIWQRLADDHGVTVAYPTLRTYVNSQRVRATPPGRASDAPARRRNADRVPDPVHGRAPLDVDSAGSGRQRGRVPCTPHQFRAVFPGESIGGISRGLRRAADL